MWKLAKSCYATVNSLYPFLVARPCFYKAYSPQPNGYLIESRAGVKDTARVLKRRRSANAPSTPQSQQRRAPRPDYRIDILGKGGPADDITPQRAPAAGGDAADEKHGARSQAIGHGPIEAITRGKTRKSSSRFLGVTWYGSHANAAHSGRWHVQLWHEKKVRSDQVMGCLHVVTVASRAHHRKASPFH